MHVRRALFAMRMIDPMFASGFGMMLSEISHASSPRSESPRVSRRAHYLGEWGPWEDQADFHPRYESGSVRLVLDQVDKHSSQWAAIQSVASKIGCTPETLRRWVRQTEIDQGDRAGLTSSERERLKQLERENRELKRSNEILRKASAYFAQAELDRRGK